MNSSPPPPPVVVVVCAVWCRRPYSGVVQMELWPQPEVCARPVGLVPVTWCCDRVGCGSLCPPRQLRLGLRLAAFACPGGLD